MSAEWQIAESKTPRGHVDLADVPVGRSVCFFLKFNYANQADFDTVIPVTISNGVATAIASYEPAGTGSWELELGHYIPNDGKSSFVPVAVMNEGSIPDNSSS